MYDFWGGMTKTSLISQEQFLGVAKQEVIWLANWWVAA